MKTRQKVLFRGFLTQLENIIEKQADAFIAERKFLEQNGIADDFTDEDRKALQAYRDELVERITELGNEIFKPKPIRATQEVLL